MKFVVFLVCLVAMVSLVVARGDQIEDLIEGHLEELDRPGWQCSESMYDMLHLLGASDEGLAAYKRVSKLFC